MDGMPTISTATYERLERTRDRLGGLVELAKYFARRGDRRALNRLAPQVREEVGEALLTGAALKLELATADVRQREANARARRLTNEVAVQQRAEIIDAERERRAPAEPDDERPRTGFGGHRPPWARPPGRGPH